MLPILNRYRRDLARRWAGLFAQALNLSPCIFSVKKLMYLSQPVAYPWRISYLPLFQNMKVVGALSPTHPLVDKKIADFARRFDWWNAYRLSCGSQAPWYHRAFLRLRDLRQETKNHRIDYVWMAGCKWTRVASLPGKVNTKKRPGNIKGALEIVFWNQLYAAARFPK